MPDASGTQQVGGIDGARLQTVVERIERLHEEREALSADIKDVYAEARGNGYDVKIIKQIVKDRRSDPADLDERDTLLTIYKRALGMVA